MTAEQGSPAWVTERLGHATASRFKDIIGRKANKEYGVARHDYMMELAYERLTEASPEVYVTKAMQWGSDMENQARVVYSERTGNQVALAGFIKHGTLKAGASPDGLIGFDGGMEIKCPFDGTRHLETLLNGMPKEHKAQVQGAMWITGAEWWAFVSYDPRLPQGPDLYVERVERDGDFIAMLEEEVRLFLDELAGCVETLRKYNLETEVA